MLRRGDPDGVGALADLPDVPTRGALVGTKATLVPFHTGYEPARSGSTAARIRRCRLARHLLHPSISSECSDQEDVPFVVDLRDGGPDVMVRR